MATLCGIVTMLAWYGASEVSIAVLDVSPFLFAHPYWAVGLVAWGGYMAS